MDSIIQHFKNSPLVTVLLAAFLLFGVLLIFIGQSGAPSKPVSHRRFRADAIYCQPISCQGEWAFGPWTHATHLVFSNDRGRVDFDFPVTRCRRVYQVVIYVKHQYYRRVGHFKRLVRVWAKRRDRAGDECQLTRTLLYRTPTGQTKTSNLIGALPFISGQSIGRTDNVGVYQSQYNYASVFTDIGSAYPVKYEILRR